MHSSTPGNLLNTYVESGVSLICVSFLLFCLTWNLTQLFGNAGIYEVYEEQRLNDVDKIMKGKMRLTITLPEDQAKDLRETLQADEGFKQVGATRAHESRHLIFSIDGMILLTAGGTKPSGYRCCTCNLWPDRR